MCAHNGIFRTFFSHARIKTLACAGGGGGVVGARLAMGVCGVVLTAIGSTLDQLAENCGTTALAVATVFLARGAG